MMNNGHRPTACHKAYSLVRRSDICPAATQIHLKTAELLRRVRGKQAGWRQEGESQLLGAMTLELQSEARVGGAGTIFQALKPEGAKLVSGSERKPIRLGQRLMGTTGKMGLGTRAGARSHRAL